jgi:5-methylcytosine-specific restriction endonuclease McrA
VIAPAPNEAAQLAFLANIQRILEEGRFTATYKFALLIALTDLAVERGDDSGAALDVPLVAIAEKFVEMYWGHTRPFAGAVLQQNTGANIALLNLLATIQRVATTLAEARRRTDWPTLLRQVAQLVRTMPLFKLQALRGDARLVFLYEERVEDRSIRLLPGVVYCLRRFSGLIRTLARNAWLDEIRSFAANRHYVAESHSLPEFLFGTDRIALDQVREVLHPLQGGCCFYCGEPMHHGSHVDHFVPFALYPAHLAHNFVLAHAGCNGDKSSLLADLPHLDSWVERNIRYGDEIAGHLKGSRIAVDGDSATGIARWAYKRAERSEALLWSSRGVTRPFPRGMALPF